MPGLIVSHLVQSSALDECAKAVQARNFCTSTSVEVDDAQPEHDQIENEKADAQHSSSEAFAYDSDSTEAVEGSLEKVPALPRLEFLEVRTGGCRSSVTN